MGFPEAQVPRSCLSSAFNCLEQTVEIQYMTFVSPSSPGKTE